MVKFIEQEAEEKANEINIAAEEVRPRGSDVRSAPAPKVSRSVAHANAAPSPSLAQEFDVEKRDVVEREKQKIREEYERKESAAEKEKRIEFSTRLNAARLRLLRARDDAVRGILAEARDELRDASDKPEYESLLVGLVEQGVAKLQATEAVIRCREVDAEKATAAMRRAEENAAAAGRELKLTLDTRAHLPPPPPPPPHDDDDDASGEGGSSRAATTDGASCIGGVHVLSVDGKVVCDVSLDDRLRVAFENNLPEIRGEIFDDGEDEIGDGDEIPGT